MQGCFTKFIRLSSADRWLVMQALVALGSAKMALVAMRLARKTMPVGRVRKVVALGERFLPMPTVSAERIAWAVKGVGERVPGFQNCLVRAIATEAILKRVGHVCELRIGMAKTASGSWLGHAWVESEGRMLIGGFEPGRFRPLTGPGRSA